MNGMLFLCYELTVNQLIIWYVFKVRKNDLQKLIQVDKYIYSGIPLIKDYLDSNSFSI